jgi:excisionase family DNA binding protein
MEQAERQVYTIKEVQKILRCSKNHVYALAAKGELPVVRLGKKIVCPRHRLEQLLDGGWTPPKGSK